MHGQFTIRRAIPDDKATWLAMRQNLWPKCPHDQQVAEIAGIIASENEACFVAVSLAGEIAGFAEAAVHPYVDWCESRPVGYLEGWYVKPEFRRQGVGLALVAAAEVWATSQGCAEMASDAYVANTVSRAAHQKLGYIERESVVRFSKQL